MKRFRGPLTTSWTRSRDNQVGPDAAVGTKPDGSSYAIYRDSGLFKCVAYTVGETDIFVEKTTASSSSTPTQLYSFLDNYTVNILTVTDMGTTIKYTLDESFSSDVSNTILYRGAGSNHIFFSKTGNNANTGKPNSPKLTAQNAIDTAVTGSKTYAVALDDETYVEKLDLKGKTVISYNGHSATIKFPALGFSGAATGLTATSVTAFAEFTYNGAPCLYASTGDGLWRTLDGMAWTQVALDNKDLRGCCVWNSKLYVTNSTDKTVNTYTDDFTAATITTTDMGVAGEGVNGGCYNIGNYVFVDLYSNFVYSAAYYDGSTWRQMAYIPSGNYTQRYWFDESISTNYAFGLHGTSFALLDISTSTFSMESYPALSRAIVDIINYNSKIYAITSTQFYRLPTISDPNIWSLVSSHNVISASGSCMNNLDWLYIFGNSSYSISKDNGASWYTYGTAPASKSTYAPAAFFRSVGMVAKATGIAYDDQVHLRGSGSINGFYVDGIGVLSQALELSRIEANHAIQYCDCYGHYSMTTDYADSVYAISNSRVHDMTKGATGIDHFGNNNHIYNITGSAKTSTTQTAVENDVTIERCGYGLICANSYGAEDSIIYGNAIDFVETSADISPTFTDTVVGSVISEQEGTYTNCSRANPLLLSDGDVKDKSGGYAYDSVAIGLGAGCYKITRTSTDAYSVDAHISKVPTGETLIWNVSNYQSNENANGEYSETWDGLKRRIELSWDADQFADNTQLGRLLDVYRQEDAVFQYGESDGTNWTPKMLGACTCSGSIATITATTAAVGKNEYAGYWVKIGTTYHRIASHPEAALGDSLALTLDTAPTGTSYSIDYILVKIDKGTAFQATQYLTSSRVVTGYSLTLREVDSE